MLVHFHETLSSNVDLLQHILLHADIVALMVSEKCAACADSLFAVDANDLYLPVMHGAHINISRLLNLRNALVRSD